MYHEIKVYLSFKVLHMKKPRQAKLQQDFVGQNAAHAEGFEADGGV